MAEFELSSSKLSFSGIQLSRVLHATTACQSLWGRNDTAWRPGEVRVGAVSWTFQGLCEDFVLYQSWVVSLLVPRNLYSRAREEWGWGRVSFLMAESNATSDHRGPALSHTTPWRLGKSVGPGDRLPNPSSTADLCILGQVFSFSIPQFSLLEMGQTVRTWVLSLNSSEESVYLQELSN